MTNQTLNVHREVLERVLDDIDSHMKYRMDENTVTDALDNAMTKLRALLSAPSEPKPVSKGCSTCYHSDSWGMPDCIAGGASCYSTPDGNGTNWKPLNKETP